MKKNYCIGLFLLFFVFVAAPVFAERTNFTFNYDMWNEQVPSPDAYRVTAFILGNALGIGNFREPQGLFIRDNRIYVCDSGNNRIVHLERLQDGSHIVVAVHYYVMINGEVSNFNFPTDLFECRRGYIYIADNRNQRVLKLDPQWNHILSIYRPEEAALEDFVEFLPYKLVTDFAGRIFVQAQNVNRGLMEFDSRGYFIGYMGANRVTFNIADYIWRFFSTAEQRAGQTLFIPTEYSNIALDRFGFIYATNATGQADPIRRLNAMGMDILIRNGHEDPIGDLVWGNAAGITGPSRFIDVAPFDNDSYAVFDRTRGRIFVYDFQGNLLYAFGGRGNREGTFLLPTALANMGFALYALDGQTGALTRFDLTLYGQLINDALSEFRAGRYDSSAKLWQEVLRMNGNFDLAYIGIGRALLRQGDFRGAMRYFRIKNFRQGYSRAFQLYRVEWMEENLWRVLLVLSIVIFTPMIVKKTIRLVKEIREA